MLNPAITEYIDDSQMKTHVTTNVATIMLHVTKYSMLFWLYYSNMGKTR